MTTFASLWQRILAFALDYLVIGLYIGLITAVSFVIGSLSPDVMSALFSNPASGQLTVFSALTLPVMFYFALTESSPWQASLGKRILRLQVVRQSGDRLSVGQSILRSAVKLIPWELAHACLWRIPGWPLNPAQPPPIIVAGLALVWIIAAAYFISLLMSKSRQTLYDRVAGAVVIVSARTG